MEKFKNKYRIPSARLQDCPYNYGTFFITICTQNRESYFGEITQGQMQLSELGVMANQEWLKTPEIRSDMNLVLGEFVVMPNHFHAILMIGENGYNSVPPGRDAMHGVSTMHRVSTFAPQSKNLASIIRGFKSAVTTFARKNHFAFNWQPRYHEHIIRNEKSYQRIANYIIDNPLNWELDKFYPAKNVG